MPSGVAGRERQVALRQSGGEKQSGEDLRLSITHSPVARAMFDRQMRYVAYSPHWLVAYRLQNEDLIGRSHYELLPEIPDRWRQVYERGLAGEPLAYGATNAAWVLVLRDVTQERQIRRRVQQQERLAAVGQLAAGIAHDFNNILAVIALYAELLATKQSKL